jgi:hypothetical protein
MLRPDPPQRTTGRDLTPAPAKAARMPKPFLPKKTPGLPRGSVHPFRDHSARASAHQLAVPFVRLLRLRAYAAKQRVEVAAPHSIRHRKVAA